MSAAAWWMVIITGVSAFVGSAGLLLIALTLREARRSANAADKAVEASQKAIETAREMGQAQVRAYLIVTAAALLEQADETYALNVSFENSGQTPASSIWVTAKTFIEIGAGEVRNIDDFGEVRFDLPAAGKDNLYFVSKDFWRALRGMGHRQSAMVYVEIAITSDDVFASTQTAEANFVGGANLSMGHIDLMRDLS